MAVFQHPEKLRLKMNAHVPNFVQEHRAATGMLEETQFPLSSIRKSAGLVPEEFALQQGAGNGPAQFTSTKAFVLRLLWRWIARR